MVSLPSRPPEERPGEGSGEAATSPSAAADGAEEVPGENHQDESPGRHCAAAGEGEQSTGAWEGEGRAPSWVSHSALPLFHAGATCPVLIVHSLQGDLATSHSKANPSGHVC